MRQRSCGNKERVGWDAGIRESLAQAFAFVPHKVTCSESLFPAPPWGFPPNGLLGSEGSSPRPLGPSLRAAAPSRPLGSGRGSDPSRPPRYPFPMPGASPSPIPSGAPPPPAPGAPDNVLFPPQDAPCPASSARSRRGPGRRSLHPLPLRSRPVPTWRGPRPRPVSSASGRLPSPPGPAPFPGGYSLKPLRISLARSSLADMMRRPPRAALPRWPGGASQTVPRNGGRSCSPA